MKKNKEQQEWVGLLVPWCPDSFAYAYGYNIKYYISIDIKYPSIGVGVHSAIRWLIQLKPIDQ